MPYEISSGPDAIELWLDRRLPFEPKAETLEARDRLREALRQWQPQSGRFLQATYTSLDASFCDVENVLFYNVEPACFAHLVADGLGFARCHEMPPSSPDGRTFEHHHRYAFNDDSEPSEPDPRCTFRFSLPRLSSSTKPHEVWWAATGVEPACGPELHEPFELCVTIETATPFPNLAAVIKPLLDGIVSSLHSDTRLVDEAVRRLAISFGKNPAEIAARLQCPPYPLLGSRDLLSCYRRFVKWNPADELCERCTLRVRNAAGAAGHAITVAIL